MMENRSKGPRRRLYRRKEYDRGGRCDGILTPSDKLFDKMNAEVTNNCLKEDVICCIRNREDLIEDLREIILAENESKRNKSRKIDSDSKSNNVNKLLCALHNTSLCVVESMIKINLVSHSQQGPTKQIENTHDNSQSSQHLQCHQNNLTFSWMGENYLMKMISDLQFLCSFDEVMNILLPEKKTLYRNPFLIPLDLDEVIGYEPDMLSRTSELKQRRMARLPWNINLERVKRAASRILFEEHRAVYGDINIVHVFPHSKRKRNIENLIDVTLPPPPDIDFKHLREVVTSNDMTFDDALVIACVRLLLGCDIEGVNVDNDCLSKQSIFRLARQPIEIIAQEIGTKTVWVQKSLLSTIYTMISRNLFKAELLVISTKESIQSLKSWLLDIVSKRWYATHSSNGNSCVYTECNIEENRIELKKTECSSVDLEIINENKENTSDYRMNDLTSTSSYMDKSSTPPKELSPVPLWTIASITKGDHKLNLVQGNWIDTVNVGDIIRIGHPYDSANYTVTRVERESIFISEAFNDLPILQTLTISDNVGDKSVSNHDCSQHSSNHKDKSEVWKSARIWKLIENNNDHRLKWRKEFDSGFVPWFPTYDTLYKTNFKIKLKWKDIERNCNDTLCNPNMSVHQQRLDYFEKVPLDDIIHETYHTICHSWHPVTPMIDNVKWVRLARTMKFLSNVKNSNHEVDMAFFRHSYKRKLDLKQFKALLFDMALQKYSSSKYDSREAMANMLWNTIVMIPQVNKMIWTKAQIMAVEVELIRTCAQIRISALIRMRQRRIRYRNIVHAAIYISKNVRCLIAKKRLRVMRNIARYYHFHRLRYASAIICQKYWRRYIELCNFMTRKKLIEMEKLRAMHEYWQILRKREEEKRRFQIFRKVINIQSILTVTSMSLMDSSRANKGVTLEIIVYVPQIRYSYKFVLNENEIRDTLEKFVVRKGPLSWNEMLQRDVLVKVQSRLMAKIINDRPIIIFCRRDIAEKGTLISRQLFPFNDILYLLSIYRSPFDFVVRLYEPASREVLRTKIDLAILMQWLVLDERMRTKETLGILKLRDIAKMSCNKEDNDISIIESKTAKDTEENFPTLLQRDKQSELIIWLVKRIQVKWDEVAERNNIILGYEADVDRMEIITRKFQSLWRAKCAKVVARKRVYLQYEKHRDWVSKNFYYVHINSGTRQWSKPKLLRANEDIVDPPDEWRKNEFKDKETGVLHTYYTNPLTGQSSWLSEDEAARLVQRKFRLRQMEKILPPNMRFAHIVKAVTMMKDTETKYTQHPRKLSNSVNFALLCHCVRFDVAQASLLYEDAMNKSSYHPVITRAYGIFMLATCKAPFIQSFEKACQLFQHAQKIDPGHALFRSAIENFFYWAVVMNPNHPLALLNYALVHQCILGEFYRAEMIYRRALAQDPTNTLVVENYKLFEDQRYPGGYYARSGVPDSILKRSYFIEDYEDYWGEWKTMKDPLSNKPSFSTFWFNTIDKTSSFEEPVWKEEWQKRVKRSRHMSSSNESLWIEYYDEELRLVFLHNRSSGEYVWKHQSKQAKIEPKNKI